MNQLRRSVRPLGLLSLCGILLVTLGCNQMLAKYSLNKAKKNRDEAVTNKAETFQKQALNDTNNLINKAQNELNAKNYPDAKATSKQASDSSKQLVTNTKIQYANWLRDEAFKWLKIADANNGQSQNAKLYAEISANSEKGRQQLDKTNYDKAISIFTDVVDKIHFLLSNLANDSKQGLNESIAMKQDLIKEGAPDFAPEYVEKMDAKITEIRDLIEKNNFYSAALSARDLARQIKQEGIQKTKEEKSRKQLQEIENLLDEATVLGAAIYAQQNYNTISKDFEQLLTHFYEKSYDTVLTTAPKLKPKVEELIVETKRAAAAAKIKEVETAINTLSEGHARQYLPGRVEQLDALLDGAKKQFDDKKFVESKDVSLRALELNQAILGEFDTLAQQQIKTASDEVGVAEGVYGTMQKIFDQPVAGNWQGDDAALEHGKQSLKQELSAQLNNARLSLGLAELKRGEKDFRTAIETAKQVAASADNVTQQTYRVVAHNAILEIANGLSYYEGQGGRQYAPAEMDKTGEMLEQSKTLLHGAKYRDAVRAAADTKAQLEILVQELQRVAVREIADAQGAISRAKGNRAEQYQSAGYNQALVALDQARQALDKKGLKSAIEAADQARTIASDVSQQSLKQWSQDLLKQFDDIQAKSQQAGADRYAGEKFQVAMSRRAAAERLYNEGAYQPAIDAGQTAVETAHEALYSKVIAAEAGIASAKRYQGWQYEPELLARAMVSAKDAREKMEAGQYSASEQFADAAITYADKVSRGAKRKSFETRMAALTEQLGQAQAKGAGYYQIRDLSKIMSQMHMLQDEFSPEGYDDLSKKVELLEAQLGGLMEMTPDVLNETLTAMQGQSQALSDRGAKEFYAANMEEISRKLKYAQMDFKNEKYRTSYQNAKDAQILLDRVHLHMDEREYDRALHKELLAFSEALHKFAPVLNMGSSAMSRMVIGMDGKAQAFNLLEANSPSDLRTDITQIGAEVNQLKPPYTRRDIHQAALNMLQLAQTAAANFEKLIILDQFQPKDARQIVDTAYVQMYRARADQGKIQKAIITPTTDFQPAGVERVVTYKQY